MTWTLPEILAGTYARIDLSRYEQNITNLRERAGSDRHFMAILKGNAYGHGAVACAGAAVRAGADCLAVARMSEALQLRQAGITAPILLLGGPNLVAIDRAIDNDITLSVGTEEALAAIQKAAATSQKRPVVQIKLDSGLHRYGADPEMAVRFAKTLAADERVILEGLYAHFSCSDEAELGPTNRETAIAERVITEIESLGIELKYIHLPNSAAIIKGLTGVSNMARSGTATYGLAPSNTCQLTDGLRPVLTLHSQLTRVFPVAKGEGISYGLTYKAEAEEWLGVVPIGYADGLPRSLSNRGWLLINGHRCPIRGRVCMDQTIVGLPGPLPLDSHVQIIGDGSDDAMTPDIIAGIDDTINYEVTVQLAARIPRVYVRDNEIVGWQDSILGESQGLQPL